MPIPDFQNLMLPMLQLAANGVKRAELLSSGISVGWARTHLRKALRRTRQKGSTS